MTLLACSVLVNLSGLLFDSLNADNAAGNTAARVRCVCASPFFRVVPRGPRGGLQAEYDGIAGIVIVIIAGSMIYYVAALVIDMYGICFAVAACLGVLSLSAGSGSWFADMRCFTRRRIPSRP